MHFKNNECNRNTYWNVIELFESNLSLVTENILFGRQTFAV